MYVCMYILKPFVRRASFLAKEGSEERRIHVVDHLGFPNFTNPNF